jgi:hypothetical protein
MNSACQRQQRRRARLRETGQHRTSVILSNKAHATLLRLTAEHGVTQSQVIDLGILTAAKWLAAEGHDDV